jgi:DNA-binding NarL/FixJ family response regulator
MKRVLIVDDHAVVRFGLRSALEANGYAIVAEASSLAQARAFIAHSNPDVLIVDINLPDGSGFDLIMWVRELSKSITIIVLTLNDASAYTSAARKAGANAYLIKDSPLVEIIAAIDFAIASPQSFNSKIAGTSIVATQLTAREIDILQSINLGYSNDVIAGNLYISLSTVKTHVSSILRKMNAQNRVQALTHAREIGLIT